MKEKFIPHAKIGKGSKKSHRVKEAFLGTRRLSLETLSDTFEDYTPEAETFETLQRDTLLSLGYTYEKTYFIKVILGRNIRVHNTFTAYKNAVFKRANGIKPFQKASDPYELARREFETAETLYETSESIAYPHTIRELNGKTNGAAIIYDYVPNTGKLTANEKRIKEFEFLCESLSLLHDQNHIHGWLNDHIIKASPDGKPLFIGPGGRAKPTEPAKLIAKGYDIASLLVQFTSVIGSVPAVQTIDEYFDDTDLIAAHAATKAAKYTIPGSPLWMTRHIRTSIRDAVGDELTDEYQRIMGKLDNDKSPKYSLSN